MKKETKQLLVGLGVAIGIVALARYVFRKKMQTEPKVDLPEIESGSSPTATAQSVTTPESTSTDVDLDKVNGLKAENFTNAAGDTYTYQIVSGPNRGGSASLSGSILTYTPAKDFVGTETLDYRIVDGDGAFSNTATITFTVTAVYDGPTAKNLTETVQEDGTVTMDIQGTDSQSPDGFAGGSPEAQTQSRG